MSRPSSRPSTDAPGLRVLQLIGDTDATREHLDTLELHRQLDALGVAVRTLALAPGGHGGLDELVPVIAPSRRSFAARSQLAAESRWADVLCLHGPTVLTHAALRRPGSAPAVVVALGELTLRRPLRRFASEREIVRRASLIVVASSGDASMLNGRYGSSDDAVRVIEDDPDGSLERGVAWVSALSDLLRPDEGHGER